MSLEPKTDVAGASNIIDYRLVKESPIYKDLIAAGIDVAVMGPHHLNHLFTAVNQNYDICDLLPKADKYFDLTSEYKFTFFCMPQRSSLTTQEIIERHCSDCASPAESSLQSNTIDALSASIVKFEIDRHRSHDNGALCIFHYDFPVQQAYRDFLNTMGIDLVLYNARPVAVRMMSHE